jgi:hypothetical protein
MNERDDDLEARWRRLSNEEPPRALDDAIRAEAHRAVHARPQPARRAWWSTWGAFAAAASVGAIAIGVWQLMPRDIDETRVAVSDATTPSVDLLAKRAETDRAAPASPAFEAKPAAPAPIAPAAAPSVVAPPTTPRIAQMPAPRAAPPASPGAPFARADKFAAAPPAAAGETASRDARSAKALAKTAPTSAAAMSDATGRGSLAAAEPADGIARRARAATRGGATDAREANGGCTAERCRLHRGDSPRARRAPRRRRASGAHQNACAVCGRRRATAARFARLGGASTASHALRGRLRRHPRENGDP